MTKRQAEAIYRLTSSPDWLVFLELQKAKLDKYHLDLEWEEKNIQFIQGAIREVKEVSRLHHVAEIILESE